MGAIASRRVPAQRARVVADRLVLAIAHTCDRIEIAGSLRRRAPDVGGSAASRSSTSRAIELVVQPKLRRDLAGEVLDDEMRPLLERMVRDDVLAPRLRADDSLGAARRSYLLTHVPSGIPVDIFAVLPPASWGAILAIRTGPREYSQALVIGARKNGLRCERGRLVRDDGRDPPEEVATPEEADFLRACGFPWANPEWRR